MKGLFFEPLQKQEVKHIFTLRHDPASIEYPPFTETLRAFNFPQRSFVQAEQTHGNQVALVSSEHLNRTIPEVDALITCERNVTLVIHTADCGPLFLYDPVTSAIGLAHSGRKGTELNILNRTVDAMHQHFQTDPAHLVAVLGPCIRPPHYDVDFVGQIHEQVQNAGIQNFFDCEHNTGEDLTQFYSYRAEKTKTGRHFSALCLV